MNIVGENFPKEIVKQINVRQEKKGAKNRTTENPKTAAHPRIEVDDKTTPIATMKSSFFCNLDFFMTNKARSSNRIPLVAVTSWPIVNPKTPTKGVTIIKSSIFLLFSSCVGSASINRNSEI
jgi:hypothetical protein